MDEIYEGADRRRHKRVDVNFIATYKVIEPIRVRNLVREDEVYAKMFDVSESGVAISTIYNIPSASMLLLRFTLIDSLARKTENRFRSMSMTGEVVYSVEFGKIEHRLGVCFKNISEEDKCSIAGFTIRR